MNLRAANVKNFGIKHQHFTTFDRISRYLSSFQRWNHVCPRVSKTTNFLSNRRKYGADLIFIFIFSRLPKWIPPHLLCDCRRKVLLVCSRSILFTLDLPFCAQHDVISISLNIYVHMYRSQRSERWDRMVLGGKVLGFQGKNDMNIPESFLPYFDNTPPVHSLSKRR